MVQLLLDELGWVGLGRLIGLVFTPPSPMLSIVLISNAFHCYDMQGLN